MAHITKFKVKGLTGRKEEIKFDLNRDTNIFHGSNGCGKTSLLKILHSAMSGDVSILKNVNFTSAEVHIFSIQEQKIYKQTITKPDEKKH